MKNKQFVLLALGALLVHSLTTPLRQYSFLWSTAVGMPVLFLYAYWALHRYGDSLGRTRTLLACLLGAGGIKLCVHVCAWPGGLLGMPDSVLRLLAIVLAYVACVYRKTAATATCVGAMAALIVLMCTPVIGGLPGWMYWTQYRNFGHFAQSIPPKPLERSLWAEARDTTETDLCQASLGRITVVEVWARGCGLCWQQMPALQQLHEKYKDDAEVYVCSVFAPGSQKDLPLGTGTRLAHEEGYSFPVYEVEKLWEDSRLRQELKMTGFPRILVLDTEGNIVYESTYCTGVEKAIDAHLRRN